VGLRLLVLLDRGPAVFSDFRTASWLWAGLGAAVLAVAIWTVARWEGIASRMDRAMLVGAAFAAAPVTSELILGNVHLLILGLLAGAWLAIRRGTPRGDVAAGALVGVAALIKVFPGLIVLWFLMTRRFRAAGVAVLTMALLAGATLPVVELQAWLDYPTVLLNLGPPTELSFVLAPTVWPSSVLPSLVARAAVRHTHPTAWILLVFLAVSGGDDDRLGGAAWIVTRALPTLGALLVVVGLIRFGRRDPRPAWPAKAPGRTSAGRGTT
jgi:hypothetical protein